MGNFRFYRRVRAFPGLSVNVSKSGPSVTVGMRGAHVTIGSTGIRKTFDIPGTGIYYTSHEGYHSGLHSAHVETPITAAQQSRAHGAATLIMIAAALMIGVAIGAAFVNR
jgi:hypothetical protein